MSSPNISLIAIHESKLMEPKAWLSTTWTIYENLRTIINVRYNNNDTKELRHIRDILQNVYHELEISSETKGSTKGTKTGFSGVDKMLVEMGKGDFIIVGARPGMGKTSFALNIATNVAKNSKKAVAIFSLEMSGEQLVTRLLSGEALVDNMKLRSGELSDDEWQRLAHAASELSETRMRKSPHSKTKTIFSQQCKDESEEYRR